MPRLVPLDAYPACYDYGTDFKKRTLLRDAEYFIPNKGEPEWVRNSGKNLYRGHLLKARLGGAAENSFVQKKFYGYIKGSKFPNARPNVLDVKKTARESILRQTDERDKEREKEVSAERGGRADDLEEAKGGAEEIEGEYEKGRLSAQSDRTPSGGRNRESTGSGEEKRESGSENRIDDAIENKETESGNGNQMDAAIENQGRASSGSATKTSSGSGNQDKVSADNSNRISADSVNRAKGSAQSEKRTLAGSVEYVQNINRASVLSLGYGGASAGSTKRASVGSVGYGAASAGRANRASVGSVGYGGASTGRANRASVGSVGYGGASAGSANRASVGSVGYGGASARNPAFLNFHVILAESQEKRKSLSKK